MIFTLKQQSLSFLKKYYQEKKNWDNCGLLRGQYMLYNKTNISTDSRLPWSSTDASAVSPSTEFTDLLATVYMESKIFPLAVARCWWHHPKSNRIMDLLLK